ncbi:zinc transporter 10 isoform X2 [Tympanuchus pallidicinctus]|uniref:zinc transporter 10 isoform X2 n=1 Tax=Tympanuchus pallidicinctus TaxID=109042 RepID=UPI00228730AB|nr:zinc transporter 10 isoform X2 [Tympanuchus pallidicinctus]
MGRYTGRSIRLIFMSLLNVGIFAVEISVAYMGNSLSLASDAFSVLSHLISMIIGLLGVRFSRIRWHKANTFGFSRADVLGAFGNSVFATALMFSIFIEAIKRYINPQKTEKALLVLIIGIVGLFFNVVNYVIFMDCCFCRAPQGDPETGESPNDQKSPEEGPARKVEKKSEALNIRGVLLHVMGDALGSVVVVIAATIFQVLPLDASAPCNWQCYIDPSLTIIMVFIILSSAFPLIKETSIILLQMVPKGVNMQQLTDRLACIPGVSSLHEVHVWELAGGKNIATLHVKCQTPTDYQDAAYKIRKVFHEAGVHSVTIQPEYIDHKTSSLLCSSPCISKACDSQLCCSQQDAPLVKTNGYTEKNDSCLSAQRKENGSSKSDIEIHVDSPLAENGVKDMKNGEMSDDKSQLSSTRF